MYAEVQEAVGFICGFLYSRIPRRRVDLFAERLANLLFARYADDWNDKERRHRHVDLNVSGHTDELVLLAAEMVGLERKDLLAHLPNGVSVLIGVDCVAARLNTGEVETVFATGGRDVRRASTLQRPRLRVKCATGDCDDKNGDAFELDYDDVHFTASSFAMTRFGAIKPKSLLAQQGPAGRMAYTTPPIYASEKTVACATGPPILPYPANATYCGFDLYLQVHSDVSYSP